CLCYFVFFFSSRRRHTRFSRDWSSDVCSSDLVVGAVDLLPDEACDEVMTPEYFIHYHLEVVGLVVVDTDPDAAILGKQAPEELASRVNHRQPLTVLEVVVVVLAGTLRVVRRIDVNARDASSEERHKRRERLEVVRL